MTTRYPGLVWRQRERGRVAYWRPSVKALAAGYPNNTVVSLEPYQHDADELSARCRALQAEQVLWMDGWRKSKSDNFDGTIGSVLRLYQTHEASDYHRLKPGSRHPYKHYLGKLEQHIGKRRVANVVALDVREWLKLWTDNGKYPAAGRMSLAVLKAALRFACASGYETCRRLRTSLDEDITVPGIKPRTTFVAAEGVDRVRAAARAAGRPSMALAYALQFESVLRQWDVRGQWVPLTEPDLSDVVDGQSKWIGLKWEDIGADMVLRFTPRKTESTSGTQVLVDLSRCPMVMEELSLLPVDYPRSGPVIVNEKTGLPYTEQSWTRRWRADRKAAGLPHKLWNRDLRASAITEARDGNVSLDDASKVAGHAKPKITGAVYDRGQLEAHRRFAEARLPGRKKVGDE